MVGRNRHRRDSLRSLRPQLGLITHDPALKQPDVERESGCSDHDHSHKESANAKGNDVAGDELHGSLQSMFASAATLLSMTVPGGL